MPGDGVGKRYINESAWISIVCTFVGVSGRYDGPLSGVGSGLDLCDLPLAVVGLFAVPGLGGSLMCLGSSRALRTSNS